MESSAWMMCTEVGPKAVQRSRRSHLQRGVFGQQEEELCVCVCFTQGTNRYFQRVASNLGLEVSFADCTKLEQLQAALKPNTKVSQRGRTYEEMHSVLCMFAFFFFLYFWQMIVQHVCTKQKWFFWFKIGGDETRKLLIKIVLHVALLNCLHNKVRYLHMDEVLIVYFYWWLGFLKRSLLALCHRNLCHATLALL